MHLSLPKQQVVMRSIENRSLFVPPKQHLPQSHYYLHEPPAWSMLAINLVAMHIILNWGSRSG
jgi:hypothetical protein